MDHLLSKEKMISFSILLVMFWQHELLGIIYGHWKLYSN